MTNPITPADLDKVCEAIAQSTKTRQIVSLAIECDLSDHGVAIAALTQVLGFRPYIAGHVIEDALDVWSTADVIGGEWRILIRQA